MSETCARDCCTRPVGRNGVACDGCYKLYVPPCVTSSLFTTRHEFTKQWLLRCIRAYVQGDPVPL
jgi:hypothetical protein